MESNENVVIELPVQNERKFPKLFHLPECPCCRKLLRNVGVGELALVAAAVAAVVFVKNTQEIETAVEEV